MALVRLAVVRPESVAVTDFSHKPTLTGDRVVLRPFRDGDADVMWESFADPESNRLTGTHTVFTEDQVRAYYNPRARRAYEKAGFVVEGVMRDALLWDGEWVDATLMSMLESDWTSRGGAPSGAILDPADEPARES